MNEPINGVSRSNIPVVPGVTSDGAKTNSAKAQSSQNTGAADVVNLTNAAETLQQLEKSLASDALISSEKVESIKQALNSGDYKINPDLIAEKFLEVERALGKV